MTAAERKSRSRAKKVAEGSAEFMVCIKGGTLNFIDQYAKAAGYSRTEVVQQFLDMAIERTAAAAASMELMLASGASDEEIAIHAYRALKSTLNEENAQKYKEVLGIK